jgi:hypothetical protein
MEKTETANKSSALPVVRGISMVGDKPSLISEKPSKGCFFYIVSPSPTDKNRRRLFQLVQPCSKFLCNLLMIHKRYIICPTWQNKSGEATSCTSGSGLTVSRRIGWLSGRAEDS